MNDEDSKVDHYQTLELKPEATLAEVNDAFGVLFRKWDPRQYDPNNIETKGLRFAAEQKHAAIRRAFYAIVDASPPIRSGNDAPPPRQLPSNHARSPIKSGTPTPPPPPEEQSEVAKFFASLPKQRFPFLQGKVRVVARVLVALCIMAITAALLCGVVFRDSFISSFPGAEITFVLSAVPAWWLTQKIFKEDWKEDL